MLPYFPSSSSVAVVDRRSKGAGAVELPPNCPRCDSSNTKFCYYNNYSLSQPRYFCKACRRYWTRGGSLRNVPVGGGCRKNRRAPRTTGRSTPPASDAGGGSRQLLQPDNSLRPDLLLDDQGPLSAAVAGDPRPGGADIDLALLYTKFMNQRSDELESGFPVEAAADEPFDLDADVADDSDHPVGAAVRLATDQLMTAAAETPYQQPSTGDDQYSSSGCFYLQDPSFCLQPQTPPSTGGEGILGACVDAAFWSNCGTVVPAGWSWQQAPSPRRTSPVGEKEHPQLQLPQPNPFAGGWNHYNLSLAGCEASPEI